jgi:hypothetical protein
LDLYDKIDADVDVNGIVEDVLKVDVEENFWNYSTQRYEHKYIE